MIIPLQKDITEWADNAFASDIGHIMKKLGKEYDELRRLVRCRQLLVDVGRGTEHYDADIADEVADIMHMLFQLASKCDFDLLDATASKFEYNKERSWKMQANGTYQHEEG